MLGDIDAAANLAVSDLDRASRFYEGTLGLKRLGSQDGGLIVYRSGKTTLNVYKSREAGTNRATAVTWTVGNQIDAIVRDLAAKGVRFEHYDLPGMQRDGDFHISGNIRVAWFKDPDGNILNLINR